MANKGREADCDIKVPPIPPPPGDGPMPKYSRGGKTKHVEDDGHKGHRRLDRSGRRKGGRLTAGERNEMPSSEFALPGKGSGPKGKGSGSYPINDSNHARNALARVSQHGTPAEKAEVRRKVHAKYPDIGES